MAVVKEIDGVLADALITVQAQVVKNPNSENIRALKYIKKQLLEIDTKQSSSKNIVREMPNIAAVVDYLKAAGYLISKSSVYEHHKAGKLKGPAKGPFAAGDVDAYARACLKRDGGGDGDELDLDDPAFQKSSGEGRRAIAQAEHWERRNKIAAGLYVEKALFEHNLAGRARIFRSDLENFARSEAGAIVALVGGDETKTPDLIEFQLAEFNKILGRYAANPELTVPKENGSSTGNTI